MMEWQGGIPAKAVLATLFLVIHHISHVQSQCGRGFAYTTPENRGLNFVQTTVLNNEDAVMFCDETSAPFLTSLLCEGTAFTDIPTCESRCREPGVFNGYYADYTRTDTDPTLNPSPLLDVYCRDGWMDGTTNAPQVRLRCNSGTPATWDPSTVPPSEINNPNIYCNVDVDECATLSNACGANARCINFPGHYYCVCLDGFEPASDTGLDYTNANSNLNCVRSVATCVAPGQFANAVVDPLTSSTTTINVMCRQGYTADPGGVKTSYPVDCVSGAWTLQDLMDECIYDIDECVLIPNICGSNARCINKPGRFYCVCREGFEPQDPTTQLNNDNNDLRCVAETCSASLSDVNLSLNPSSAQYEEEVTFECDVGYRPSYGADPTPGRERQFRATCTDDGLFQPTGLPMCQPLDCGDSGMDVFASHPATATTFGTSVKYTCLTGYSYMRDSNQEREYSKQCLADGTWSAGETCSEDNECESDPCPPNASCVSKPGMFWCVCEEGYINTGGIDLRCELVTCGHPGPIYNAQLTSNTAFTFGSVASYTCKAGYSTNSNLQTTCQANGQWTVITGSCQDVNECQANPTICGESNDLCINTIGSYMCSCFFGRSLNSNSRCEAIPRSDIEQLGLEVDLASLGCAFFLTVGFCGGNPCDINADGLPFCQCLPGQSGPHCMEETDDFTVPLILSVVSLVLSSIIGLVLFIYFCFFVNRASNLPPAPTQIRHFTGPPPPPFGLRRSRIKFQL